MLVRLHLEKIANMKEKNLPVEVLKNLIAEQVSVHRKTNPIKSAQAGFFGILNLEMRYMLTKGKSERDSLEKVNIEMLFPRSIFCVKLTVR